MIISTAITFATQHPAFNQFMMRNRLNPEAANVVTAQVVKSPSHQLGALLISVDFRPHKPNLVQVGVTVNLSNGSLTFTGIQMATNPRTDEHVEFLEQNDLDVYSADWPSV